MPLYLEIAEEFEGRILRGTYHPGDRLPAERELARQEGVNRHTAAQALRYLQNKGLVVRVRGRGTFVRPPRIDFRVAKNPSFSDSVARVGLKPSHKILSARRIGAYGRLCEELRVPAGEPLVALERIRFAGEIPMNYGRKHFREMLFPDLYDQLPLGGGSLRVLIKTQYGLDLFRAHTKFGIEPADEMISHYLGVPPGATLFKLERLDTLEDGTPAEWGTTHFRGDAVEISVITGKMKGEDDRD